MLEDYWSFYERMLEKFIRLPMGVKRNYKLYVEIYKTLNDLNPSLMKEIFELRLCSRAIREQYKLNLNIPRKKQATFGTKSLEIIDPKIWNNISYHIKSSENLNVFKNLIKNETIRPVVAMCVAMCIVI